MHIIATLPVIVKWIESDKELTEEDFNILKKMYPEQYQFGVDSTLEGLIEMNSRHRDSKLYKKFIEILLSDQGVKWLAKNHVKLVEHSKKYPG